MSCKSRLIDFGPIMEVFIVYQLEKVSVSSKKIEVV